MLYLSIALFAIAAVFGLIILVKWLTHKEASRAVIYTHGLLAAVALVLVVVYALQHPDNYPRISLIIFLVTAVLGFYMFIRDLMKKFSPMAVAFIHAFLAVGAVVALAAFLFIK